VDGEGGGRVGFKEGILQGNPLGPILFRLTLAVVLNDFAIEFIVAYLDNVTFVNSVDRLGQVGTSDSKL